MTVHDARWYTADDLNSPDLDRRHYRGFIDGITAGGEPPSVMDIAARRHQDLITLGRLCRGTRAYHERAWELATK